VIFALTLESDLTNISKKMKKVLLIALLSIIYSSVFSQTDTLRVITQTDSLGAIKDSIATSIFPNSTKIKDKKSKKETQAEADSVDMSYAAEFKKSKVRFTWGLRGGVNIGQFLLTEVSTIRVLPNGLPQLGSNNRVIRDRLLNNQQFGIGYIGGLFARMTRGSFYFQPELMYAVKAGKFDIVQDDGSLFKRINTTVTAVDLPIMFGIRFRKGRIFAGPNISFPFQVNNEFSDAIKLYMDEARISTLKTDLLQRPVLSFQGGIGFEFQHLFLDIRYEGGLSNISNATLGIPSQPSTLNFKQNLLQLTLGIIR
jgi:hypothetical protein